MSLHSPLVLFTYNLLSSVASLSGVSAKIAEFLLFLFKINNFVAEYFVADLRTPT
jgi:hypothetical protein